jgi:hypothetical protein
MKVEQLGIITELPAPFITDTVRYLVLENKEQNAHAILKADYAPTGNVVWIDISLSILPTNKDFIKDFPNGAEAILIIFDSPILD